MSESKFRQIKKVLWIILFANLFVALLKNRDRNKNSE